MATSIFGFKTIPIQPKSRIELYLCDDIPPHEFTVDEIINMLVRYKNRLKEIDKSIYQVLYETGLKKDDYFRNKKKLLNENG